VKSFQENMMRPRTFCDMPKPLERLMLALLALSIATLLIRWFSDFADAVDLPPSSAKVYTAQAREKLALGKSATSLLRVGAEQISLGDEALVKVVADAQGVAHLPLAITNPKPQSSKNRVLRLVHEMDYDKALWSGESLVIRGLVPHASYETAVGLWVWSKPEGGAFKAYPLPGSVAECAGGCVAAIGQPRLIQAPGEWALTVWARDWLRSWALAFWLPLLGGFWIFLFGDNMARAVGLVARAVGWKSGVLDVMAPRVL
jgi:hypothetical protein